MRCGFEIKFKNYSGTCYNKDKSFLISNKNISGSQGLLSAGKEINDLPEVVVADHRGHLEVEDPEDLSHYRPEE